MPMQDKIVWKQTIAKGFKTLTNDKLQKIKVAINMRQKISSLDLGLSLIEREEILGKIETKRNSQILRLAKHKHLQVKQRQYSKNAT